MKKLLKALLFLFAISTVAFSKIAPTDQEIPEYCMIVIEQDDTSYTSTFTLDGVNQIEPEITDDFNEYQFLLQRAENGRGNGSIQYSNLALPIGDGQRYALVEFWNTDNKDQPNDDSRIFPGDAGENGELVFEIADLAKRGNFSLSKVLTIEEVEECNQFFENEIDLESLYQVDGLVYIPLNDYGIIDKFAMGIKAPDKTLTENDTSNGTNVDDSDGDESNDDVQNDNPIGGDDPCGGPGCTDPGSINH
jgi:hypothetical protein